MSQSLAQVVADVAKTYLSGWPQSASKLPPGARARAAGLADLLADARYFELSSEIISFAFKEISAALDSLLSEFDFDASAKPPHNVCVLGPVEARTAHTHDAPVRSKGVFVVNEQPDGWVYVGFVSPCHAIDELGAFKPGFHVHDGMRLAAHQDEQRTAFCAHGVLQVAIILSLIGQPSFTKTTPMVNGAGQTAAARAIAKLGGPSGTVFRRISWDLGGTHERAAGGGNKSDRKMPLHFTRGHWRRVPEGTKGASVLRCGGTFTWVRSHWSGHPAYGVVHSVHAPRLSENTPTPAA